MNERHSTRRDHILRGPLTDTLRRRLDTDVSDLVEDLLVALNDNHVITYAPAGNLALLSAAGRVLVTLAEKPGVTVREISVYVGVTETNTTKVLANLINAGLIEREKAGTSYRYRLTPAVSDHPDIKRFHTALAPHLRS